MVHSHEQNQYISMDYNYINVEYYHKCFKVNIKTQKIEYIINNIKDF